MADMTSASVTLYVEVLDAQAMWDHAHNAYALAHLDHKIHDEAQPTRLASELLAEFVSLCGTREQPDIGDCLRMIFDPGESPPGILIEDSSAKVEGPRS
ncbi:hypothetical protein PX554_19010 [Sphingomonas sp. H39-1-10]|uniref:hypothetical protein n=1 Tax=Sphingomonas pollutisoli TaxID=3030829 RepID=UPI0023B930AE|nr:hypothetical protein [Sphingomonas pollutisoli]MDF0490222.1 hypothetical protein [Sphingomonas pollutisoli]